MRRSRITLRNETEWAELASARVNQVVGTNPIDILTGLKKAEETESSLFDKPLFGDGHAAINIVKALANFGEN